MNPGRLYFIALVLPGILGDEVQQLKEEIRSRCGAAHALKSPAHITLQMPFKRAWNESDEEQFAKGLADFASNEPAFQVELDGFGAFPPRVIFVKVRNHAPMIALHSRLQQRLRTEMHFHQSECTEQFHPHVTIATRDLSAADFKGQWPAYEQRPFTAAFHCGCMSLLRHNGKSWEVWRDFPFGAA